jgi:F-type H+-transporting ATPase subunit a
VNVSPDAVVLFELAPFKVNATMAWTWAVMLLLVVGSWAVTRRLTGSEHITRGQNVLEVLVLGALDQIREVGPRNPERYLPFVGSLFIFIAVSNTLAVIPGYEPPTGSLSTTAALALCVFVAVPWYGVRQRGLGGYLKQYLQPSPFMLPFNIIGEVSRTLSLAVRLFGNIMSGSMIVAILLAIAPLLFPVVMQVLGLLTGLIQAYIFAMLAMVFIASAVQDPAEEPPNKDAQTAAPGANHG